MGQVPEYTRKGVRLRRHCMALAECSRFFQRSLGSAAVFLAVEERCAERIIKAPRLNDSIICEKSYNVGG